MRALARVFLSIFIATTLISPMKATAAVGQFNATWFNMRLGTPANWTEVTYPGDNWQVVAELEPGVLPDTFDVRMIQGDRWITVGRDELGAAGVDSKRLSDLVKAFPAGGAMVFARYSPQTAELRINAVKVEKGIDGKIRMMISDFTPHHGERWRASRNYLTPSELADPARPGYNPFDQFRRDPTDPVFHNINLSGALVAVGHAMQYTKAFVGMLAVTEPRFEQEVRKSGGILKKKVTTIVRGYAKPKWFVALPKELQPRGFTAQICVIPRATSCDAIEHVAPAGVSFEPWTGGNMPEMEDLLSVWSQTKSSWTVLAFAVLTAVLVGFAAYLTPTLFANSAMGANIIAYGKSLADAALIGAAAGGIYGAGTIIDKGGSWTSPQDGMFGATDSGFMDPATPGSEPERMLVDAIRARHVNGTMEGGLTGVRELYSGNCPIGWTSDQCKAAGYRSGIAPRTDTWAAMNTVRWLRDNYDRCKSLGYSGAELLKCAAPGPYNAAAPY